MVEAPDGCLTLDIGCGSGLLSLMAARAGSGHVFACDKVRFRVGGLGFMVWGLELRVWGLGCRVQGLGCRF